MFECRGRRRLVRAEPDQPDIGFKRWNTVMEATAISSSAQTGASVGSRTAQALSGEDFFQLLITQLSNQDPLEPTSNEELLNQIASIRDIELSSALAESLQSLTDQQRYGSAATLLGRYVTGAPDPEDPASTVEGVVVGVRYTDEGQPILQLDGGQELALDDVDSVTTTEQAALSLVGKMITGVDAGDPDQPTIIEGLVTGVRSDADGTILLELDTGETVPLDSVASTFAPDLFADDRTSSA